MGDLNYRIDGLEMEKVKSCVEKNDLENLLPYDQVSTRIEWHSKIKPSAPVPTGWNFFCIIQNVIMT